MLTIGLTGGIGSGKTTVGQWFRGKEIPVFDSDKIVHGLFEKDAEVIKRIEEEIGAEFVIDGEVKRSLLGQKVFSEVEALKKLEAIIHPRVISNLISERNKLMNEGAPICIWDVPLLYETGWDKFVDEVWVVWVDEETQVERIKSRDKLSLKEIKARIESQLSLDEKAQKADVVINNNKNWQETLDGLENEWERIKQQLKL